MKNNIIVPSSQFVDEKFKEYIFRLPFLYEHRDDIYSNATTGLKAIVNSNDTIHVERFRYTGFGGLVHRIAVCYEECQFPYRESPLTLHDVISQLDEQEHNGRSVCR